MIGKAQHKMNMQALWSKICSSVVSLLTYHVSFCLLLISLWLGHRDVCGVTADLYKCLVPQLSTPTLAPHSCALPDPGCRGGWGKRGREAAGGAPSIVPSDAHEKHKFKDKTMKDSKMATAERYTPRAGPSELRPCDWPVTHAGDQP